MAEVMLYNINILDEMVPSCLKNTCLSNILPSKSEIYLHISLFYRNFVLDFVLYI